MLRKNFIKINFLEYLTAVIKVSPHKTMKSTEQVQANMINDLHRGGMELRTMKICAPMEHSNVSERNIQKDEKRAKKGKRKEKQTFSNEIRLVAGGMKISFAFASPRTKAY